jgi:hypothetical protein
LITIDDVAGSENELYQRHFISGMYVSNVCVYVSNVCIYAMCIVYYACMYYVCMRMYYVCMYICMCACMQRVQCM